jgi:hypothetical protein
MNKLLLIPVALWALQVVCLLLQAVGVIRDSDLLLKWYDFWIGLYWDKKNRWLYVFGLPCIGVCFKFGARQFDCRCSVCGTTWRGEWKSLCPKCFPPPPTHVNCCSKIDPVTSVLFECGYSKVPADQREVVSLGFLGCQRQRGHEGPCAHPRRITDPMCVCGHLRSQHDMSLAPYGKCTMEGCACGPGCIHDGFAVAEVQ